MDSADKEQPDRPRANVLIHNCLVIFGLGFDDMLTTLNAKIMTTNMTEGCVPPQECIAFGTIITADHRITPAP
jgi:hypothetical protein